MRNAQQTAVESYEITTEVKKTHMAGQQVTDLTYFISKHCPVNYMI